MDADGILNVSAKDKETGKARSIEIKGSSGLDEDEVERMVREAAEQVAKGESYGQLTTVRHRAEATCTRHANCLKI